ncbi:MAG: ThuA domain-containing protein [Bryobacteraceae bacterium]|nr:ThuA domain-containing protein [Bryobacteraceae bacterium]MDW8378030.1 ThuA domain-containing protein [Bryobacterales bacterium]
MKPSRRQLLAAFTSAGLPLGSQLRSQTAQAFALIGDRYHNSDYIRTALSRTLNKELGLAIDFCDETKRLQAEALKGRQLLIVFRDGMIWPDGYPDESTNAGWLATGRPALEFDPPAPKTAAKPAFWMTPDQGKAVRRFVEDGGSALFFHNATHIGLTNADFRHVLGAAYTGHPPIRRFRVKVTNPAHPITQGVKDFLVTDEQHYMDYDRDRKYIFLESVNEDGLSFGKQGVKAPAGWAFEYGRGRVCYLSPGHLLTVLWNPEYVKLQQNAVRWLLRKTH